MDEQKDFSFQAPRGMRDVLPLVASNWRYVEQVLARSFQMAGFEEIRTPLVEKEDLFVRSLGEATDIIEKEMYQITAKGEDAEKLVLRPEGTAGVVRAYLEHGMQVKPQPVKLYYLGPMFRYDRPQAQRFRQFHQAGVEVIGDGGATTDAELIALLWKILRDLGLSNLTIQINSIGEKTSRKKYLEKLLEYFEPYKVDLPEEDRKRLKGNPLRILDSKSPQVQKLLEEAPQIVDYLTSEDLRHFKDVLEFLDDLEVPYDLNPFLVRGLDYYTHTVFEIFGKEAGAQSALAGGGRYDYLMEMLGGPKTSAVGFAVGVERLIHEMLTQEVAIPETTLRPKVIVISLGDAAKKLALKMEAELWREGIPTTSAMGKESIRAQLKLANKQNIPFALIVGQKEALSGSVILRDMIDGVQETIALKKYLDLIKKKLAV